MEAIATDVRLGWGFLGSGGIARTVAAQISAEGGARFAAAFGRDRNRTRAFAAEFGFAAAHDDPAGVLDDPLVEAVYLALPHSLHIDLILRALDAGKHVLCEKPLAMSAAEVCRIAAHPAAGRLRIAEGFMMRHHPQWRWVGDAIRAGAIGQVRAAHLFLSMPRPLQPDIPKLPGEKSMLLDIGCYYLHLARYLFGGEPSTVSAGMDLDPAGLRDTGFSARIGFGSGAANVTVMTGLSPARRIHVLGTAGQIEMFNPVQPQPDGTSALRLVTASGVEERVFERTPQYALQFRDFEHAVREEREPLVPLADALGNARLIDAIRTSAARGGEQVPVH